MNEERANQLTGGVALIGLGLLFATSYWWPGLLFYGGAVSMTQAIVEGKRWYAAQGALWCFGLGLVFAFGFSWWMIFILMGLSMIFGRQLWGGNSGGEEEGSDYESAPKRKREADRSYRVGDDGELVPQDDYVDDKRKNSRA